MGEILQVEWWQLLCIIEATSGGEGKTFEINPTFGETVDGRNPAPPGMYKTL